MGDTDEDAMEASLQLYRSQLSQVTQAIQATGESEDLKQLKNDLEELIKLTEENLLETKKAKLLKSLETEIETVGDAESAVSRNEDDDEYAAFKKAIGDSPDPRSTSQKPTSSSEAGYKGNRSSIDIQPGKWETNVEDESDEDESQALMQANLMELIGTKCRAPFSQDWGHLHYCNAMIWSSDPPGPDDDVNDHKVHVIFINPTHQSMIPCKYFMDGACRFSDDECRFSHGYPVKVSELQAYVEPDHSKIAEGCRCLAKYTDEVWYQASVLEVCNNHEVHVLFDKSKETHPVKLEHIVPLDSDESVTGSSESDEAEYEDGPSSSSNLKGVHDDDSDEESEVPVYLWKPTKTMEKLGAWESHTRGIGSKLMAKMGYVTGQGLGRNGEGRAEPVPILLLPQGKSLDKIMELKEMSGNADLFNAMKKLEKRQKILEKKEAEKEQRREKRESLGVFGFLNKELGTGKGRRKEHTHSHPKAGGSSPAKHSSEKELTQRSDKEVNVQIFKTAEEIRAVERQLSHLRQQLSRNETRDRKMAQNVRQKIAEQESYLHKLKTSSQTLETHKDRRKAHKKLTIF